MTSNSHKVGTLHRNEPKFQILHFPRNFQSSTQLHVLESQEFYRDEGWGWYVCVYVCVHTCVFTHVYVCTNSSSGLRSSLQNSGSSTNLNLRHCTGLHVTRPKVTQSRLCPVSPKNKIIWSYTVSQPKPLPQDPQKGENCRLLFTQNTFVTSAISSRHLYGSFRVYHHVVCFFYRRFSIGVTLGTLHPYSGISRFFPETSTLILNTLLFQWDSMNPHGIYVSVHRKILSPSPSERCLCVFSSGTQVFSSLTLPLRYQVPYGYRWSPSFSVSCLRGDLGGLPHPETIMTSRVTMTKT